MKRLCLLLLGATAFTSAAQPSLSDANRVFEVARQTLSTEGGILWGLPLSGPLLVAEPDSRLTWADHPAPGFTRVSEGRWRGTLPDSVGIANTSLAFGDTTWAMVLWPAPEDMVGLRRLIAHEMWHRVQGELGLPSGNPANEHLSTRDGRVLLILEMRALARALERPWDIVPLRHALFFRTQRVTQFPQAASEERALMMHEGLAQYTGLAAAGLQPDHARKIAAGELIEMQAAQNFSRSFAYGLGPAYGLLLDLHRPGWRAVATAQTDLAELVPLAPAVPPEDAYGAPALVLEEDRREAGRLAELAALTERYVTGPRVLLPFGNMNVTFDPGEVSVLAGHGTIYASLRLTDSWGVLTVNDGALILSDWSGVVVPAPESGADYTLELADGWSLVPGEETGLLVARRR